MRHHLLSSPVTMSPPPPHKTPNSNSSIAPTITKKPSLSNPNCHHSPSATLDILILILVVFSGAFLISSYISYIFNSLSLLLPPNPSSSLLFSSFYYSPSPSPPFLFAFALFFLSALLSFRLCCCPPRSTKCGRPNCKALKKAMEFDLQIQTHDCLKLGSKAVTEVDQLPWKGGSEANPDYDCLRAELRKMAPANGRAVLLFRAKCGCPVAKLEGWSFKRGRKHKKSLALKGGDHR